MALLATKTITVRNLYSNAEEDIEKELCTTLVGCSAHSRTVATASATGLAAASISQIRIFSDGTTLAATQRAPTALVPAVDKFAAPKEWAAQDLLSAADSWTLRPGDKIEVDGQAMTILAVHDNRQGRRFPHWYVEAH